MTPPHRLPTPDGLQLRLLGTPLVVMPGSPAPQRRALTAQEAVLLAWLVLKGPVQRPRIASLLWPEAGAPTAANNLRQRLHGLRRFPALVLAGPQAGWLCLPEAVAHDLADPRDRLREDPAAVGVDLLGSFDYGKTPQLATWVTAERERWRQTVVDGLLQWAVHAEHAGDAANAARWAARALELSPTSAAATRVLMRVHHQQGEREAALAAFERCGEALRAVGGAPDADTLALARLVGRSRPVQAQETPQLLPLALRHPPRTVGRAALQRTAMAAWNIAGCVLLTGPPGIGKSRVLDDLTRATSAALSLRPGQDEQAVPYGVLTSLVSSLMQRCAPTLAARHERLRAFIAAASPSALPGEYTPTAMGTLMRAFLADVAGSTPLTLVIDDLQHADPRSLEVLTLLWPRTGPVQPPTVRWLLGMRDSPVPAAVDGWLKALDPALEPVVPVPLIGSGDVAELLSGLCVAPIDFASWGARLQQHCGGHPLYLLQVLRELAHRGEILTPQAPDDLPLPAEALAGVARRLECSDAITYRLAHLAALMDGDLDARLLQRLLGCETATLAAAWRALQALQVLGDHSFSHELVRQAVLGTIPTPIKPLLHQELASAMPADPAARRAPHWEAAGDAARAAADWLRAAGSAHAHGLVADACVQLGHAQRLYAAAGQAGHALQAGWRRGHLMLLSSAAEARAMADQLMVDAEGAGVLAQARALELRACAKAEQHEPSAVDDARAAGRLARAADDTPLHARAALAQAQAWAALGRHRRSARLLRALDAKRPLLDDHTLQQADELGGVVRAHLGHRRAAVAAHRALLARALATHRPAAAAAAAGNLGVQLGYLNDVQAAQTMYRQALELSRRAGVERGFLLIDETGLAGCLIDEGRYQEALAMLERCARELREDGFAGWALNADNDRATLLLLLGRPDSARELLHELPANAPPWALAGRQFARARLARWSGASGLVAIRQARVLLTQGGAIGTPYVAAKVALEEARHQSPAAAARQADDTLRWAEEHEHLALSMYARLVRLEAWLALGRAREAAHAADELHAASPPERPIFSVYRPELWSLLCSAWQGVGRQGDAEALAAAARQWLRETAGARVPPAMRRGFLGNNPFNRRLLGLGG